MEIGLVLWNLGTRLDSLKTSMAAAVNGLNGRCIGSDLTGCCYIMFSAVIMVIWMVVESRLDSLKTSTVPEENGLIGRFRVVDLTSYFVSMHIAGILVIWMTADSSRKTTTKETNGN